MSLWNRLINHPGFQRVKTLYYDDQFPLEVRWNAANFLQSLIQHVESEKQKLKPPEGISIAYRLDGAIQTFTQHLYHPFEIYKRIRDCISYEKHFLENYCDSQQIKYMDHEAIDITDKLKALQNQMQSNKVNEFEYKRDIENYKVLEQTEASNRKLQLSSSFVEDTGQRKGSLSESIGRCAIDLHRGYGTIMLEIDAVQKLILKRLNEWQRDQVLAVKDTLSNASTLDEIQSWFEILGEIIWNMRLSIKAIRDINRSMKMGNAFEQPYKDITTSLRNLIDSGFIVVKQPQQVLEMNTRFAATVRLLPTNLCMQQSKISVVASILSESQAQAFARQKNQLKQISESFGTIVNNTENLKWQQSTRRFLGNLRFMHLKKIKRASKKVARTVTDEKFAILFQSTLRMAGIKVNIWVISLPVVVIAHANQEPQSWATITWDNAITEISGVPFHVPAKGNWSHMANALSRKFKRETGRGLTTENLFHLRKKALGRNVNSDPIDQSITWHTFCKDTLPGRMFTFWDWFFAAMTLTRDHLRGPWAENAIFGFINRRQAELKLLQCPPGTFLLRFSDSVLGGLSVAWVENCASNKRVVMLEPFCSRDLEIQSLGDRLKELHQCVTLYSDIPKDSAFKKHYSPIVLDDDDTSQMLNNLDNQHLMQRTFVRSNSRVNGSKYDTLTPVMA